LPNDEYSNENFIYTNYHFIYTNYQLLAFVFDKL